MSNFDNESETIELEADWGQSVDIEKEIETQLLEKGKLATCKIITMNNIGSGFFCKIPIKDKTIKMLFTNNYILNKDSIQIGKIIRYVYKGKMKEIEITEDRIYVTNDDLDYTGIQIFKNDGIEDFYEIDNENIKNPNEKYSNEDICIMQFPKDGLLTLKTGCLNKIIESEMKI